MTGGQLVDADIVIPDEEEKPVARTDDGTNLPVRSGSEKSGNVKKQFVLQCNPKDRRRERNSSLRSSQKGNKLFDNENIEPIQPLLKNDQMEFNPAINHNSDFEGRNTAEPASQDPNTFWQQLVTVTKLAVGPIVGMIFQQLVQLVNTYSVGHTNEAALIAGVGMGNMLINILGFAIMQGLNGALESLIS